MKGRDGGPLFWKFFVNKVADAVLQRDDGKALELLGQHKKLKRERKFTYTCSVCTLSFDAYASNTVPCAHSIDCKQVWCGRQELCDASKWKCEVCNRFNCPECARHQSCFECGNLVCESHIYTCSKCSKEACLLHFPKDDTCQQCYRDTIQEDAMYHDHINNSQ